MRSLPMSLHTTSDADLVFVTRGERLAIMGVLSRRTPSSTLPLIAGFLGERVSKDLARQICLQSTGALSRQHQNRCFWAILSESALNGCSRKFAFQNTCLRRYGSSKIASHETARPRQITQCADMLSVDRSRMPSLISNLRLLGRRNKAFRRVFLAVFFASLSRHFCVKSYLLRDSFSPDTRGVPKRAY